MASENLGELISSLTPAQQEWVRRFIEYLKQGQSTDESPILHAADEFIAAHPDLLRQLAQ